MLHNTYLCKDDVIIVFLVAVNIKSNVRLQEALNIHHLKIFSISFLSILPCYY